MLRTLSVAVTVAMLAAPAGAAGRNVVLFVADDHGAEALGAYGNPVVKTPTLDQLASEGVRFTLAFATTASCSASRSVLLTGVHNHRNGQFGHEHEYHHFRAFPNVRSLPVMLAEAGYRTARGGKFHVAPEGVFHFQHVLTLAGLEAFIRADSSKPLSTGGPPLRTRPTGTMSRRDSGSRAVRSAGPSFAAARASSTRTPSIMERPVRRRWGSRNQAPSRRRTTA